MKCCEYKIFLLVVILREKFYKIDLRLNYKMIETRSIMVSSNRQAEHDEVSRSISIHFRNSG